MFFAKVDKNVSFTQKWVKNLVKFPGSEKIFKNILKVFKLKFAWVTKPLNFIYPFLRKTHIFLPIDTCNLFLPGLCILNLTKSQKCTKLILVVPSSKISAQLGLFDKMKAVK